MLYAFVTTVELKQARDLNHKEFAERVLLFASAVQFSFVFLIALNHSRSSLWVNIFRFVLNTVLFTALFSIARCSYDSFYLNEGLTDEDLEQPIESYFIAAVFWATVICANILAGILIFWGSVIAALLGASIFCPRWLNGLFMPRRFEMDEDSFVGRYFDSDEVMRRVKRIPFSSVLLEMGDSRECTICFEIFAED